MVIRHLNSDKESILLEKFNSRDYEAFSEVYILYYDDLYYFASRLFRGTEISAYDVIQDVFIHLWEIKKQKFEGLNNLKAYLFVCVKNNFKNYLSHRKYKENYELSTRMNDESFVAQIVEMEVFSFLKEAIHLLPEECGKVFQGYLNGLDTKEIAEKLHKTESTVYNQKKNAVEILRKKLSKEKMFLITLLIQ